LVITKKGGEKKGGIFFCLGVFFFDTRGLLEGKKKNVGKVEGVVFFLSFFLCVFGLGS
jgi:hypothetical protein